MKIDEVTVKATQEEILERIEAIEHSDMFGEYRPRLVGFLNYENAKPFLKDSVIEKGWEVDTEKDLREELHRYMEDWWKQKIEGGRGISVHRGRAQVVNLLFLAGIPLRKEIGIDSDEGIDGGWYQEDAYNLVADLFELPHIQGSHA